MRNIASNQKRLKRKYPILTFSALKMLRLHGMTDWHIQQMYGIKKESLQSFEKNHTKVLRKVRDWA